MKLNIQELVDSTKKLCVLYVEDNPVARKHTSIFLEEFFGSVELAVDGQNGVQKYMENKDSIDLIITDIDMPNLNGVEMALKIREIDGSVPIVILSAYSDTSYFIDTIKVGIDGYLLKPISMAQFSTAIERVIQKICLQKENDRYKKDLEDKVNEQVQVIRKQDEVIYKHSKLAAMGEMMDAIIHQWRQPLGVIKLACDVEPFIEGESLPSHIAFENSNMIKVQVDYMLNTIEEFRNFLRPDYELVEVSLGSIYQSIMTILKDELIKNVITLTMNADTSLKIKVVPNEFKHVLINIINNSKDAFVSREKKDRQIKLDSFKEDSYCYITLSDNAGGVSDELLEKIFSANISTKGEQGSGIGLYISEQIIQKIGGDIYAENANDGLKVTLKIPC